MEVNVGETDVRLWLDCGGSTPVVGLTQPGCPPVVRWSRSPVLEGLAPLLSEVLRTAEVSPENFGSIAVATEGGSVLGLRCGIATARALSLRHPYVSIYGYDRLLAAALGGPLDPPFTIVTPVGSGRVRFIRVSANGSPGESALLPREEFEKGEGRPCGLPVLTLDGAARFRPPPPDHWHHGTGPDLARLAASPSPHPWLHPLDEAIPASVTSFQKWTPQRHR